jgi:hypothetical protein
VSSVHAARRAYALTAAHTPPPPEGRGEGSDRSARVRAAARTRDGRTPPGSGGARSSDDADDGSRDGASGSAPAVMVPWSRRTSRAARTLPRGGESGAPYSSSKCSSSGRAVAADVSPVSPRMVCRTRAWSQGGHRSKCRRQCAARSAACARAATAVASLAPMPSEEENAVRAVAAAAARAARGRPWKASKHSSILCFTADAHATRPSTADGYHPQVASPVPPPQPAAHTASSAADHSPRATSSPSCDWSCRRFSSCDWLITVTSQPAASERS